MTVETCRDYLEGALLSKDKKYIPWLESFCLLCFVVHEFGFQCDEKQNTRMQKLLLKALNSGQQFPPNDFEPQIPNQRPPKKEDFEIARKIFQELKPKFSKKTLPDLLKFLERRWNVGAHQQRVYNMDSEGSITNEAGIAVAPAMELLVYDNLKGFLNTLVSKN